MQQQQPVAVLHLYDRDLPIYDFSIFSELDAEEILLLHTTFFNDPIVTVASSVALNDMLGGGIIFQRQGKILTEEAALFYDECYSRFLADMIRSLWMFGIAACVIEPHPRFVGVPRVLDLRQLRILLYQDITNVRHYVFFRRPKFEPSGKSEPFPFSPLMDDQPLSGVLLFEMDPPDSTGKLRSKLLSVFPELQYHRELQYLHFQAAQLASNPVVIEEQPENRYDPENLTFGVVPTAEGLGEVDNIAKVTHVSLAEWDARIEAYQKRFSYSSSAASSDAAAKQLGIKTFQLNKNTKLARQLPPQDLSLVLEHRVMCEEVIAALFGVPRGMFAQSSYNQRTSNSKQKEEEQMMFQRAQMRLKALLQTFLYQIYYSIYGKHHVYEAITRNADLEATLDDIEKEASVQITIAGVPNPSTLQLLYYEGSLKYERYIELIAATQGLPIQFFNDQPQLTLQELNGIKDATTTSTDESGSSHKQKVTETEKKVKSADGGTAVTTTRSVETEIPDEEDGGGGGGGTKKRKANSKSPNNKKKSKKKTT